MHLILLSGGSGKRLWPLSNDVRSKQFIKAFEGPHGELESMVQRVYRQIMEVDGVSEGATASLNLQLTGVDIQIDGEDPDGRQFEVNLYIHAAALLYEEREITLLNDLYSTAYEVSYEADPLMLHGFFETVARRQTMREVLEIGVEAQSVLTVSVVCGAVSISRERDSNVLRTGATVRVLYLDEGGVPLLAERCLDVSCQLEMPGDCQMTARAVCLEEAQGIVGDRGIEVRFPVDFQRDVMGLGVLDLLFAGLDIPLAPGSDDGHVGGKVLDGQFETNLIVALTGAAVHDGVCAFLEGDFYQTSRYSS